MSSRPWRSISCPASARPTSPRRARRRARKPSLPPACAATASTPSSPCSAPGGRRGSSSASARWRCRARRRTRRSGRSSQARTAPMSETRPLTSGDFWLSSGFPLLHRDASGNLQVSDDFLRAYLARPELRPVQESCAAETALHSALLADPRQMVDEGRLATLADADMRDNYRHLLRFRDRLLASPSLEACYLGLFRAESVDIPPLFVDHLAHVILRNILDGCTDSLRLRAAELLFRSQKVTLEDGAVMLADEETVEMYAATGGFGSLGRLLAENQTPMRNLGLARAAARRLRVKPQNLAPSLPLAKPAWRGAWPAARETALSSTGRRRGCGRSWSSSSAPRRCSTSTATISRRHRRWRPAAAMTRSRSACAIGLP